jgi:carbonic anhydrase
MPAKIAQLIAGYQQFHQQYFQHDDGDFQKLVREGQSPSVAIIACSDSRVDPSIVMDSKLGELFVIRNVANLVPPFQPDDHTYHGTSAALEFAVKILQVKHVIVFGHSKCAGIRALMEDNQPKSGAQSFIRSWMNIASDVRQEVIAHHHDASLEHQSGVCERKAVEKSLANLATFPFVQERIEEKNLFLHGWHFDLDEGHMRCFDPVVGDWKALV